jgi:hypothetical protein
MIIAILTPVIRRMPSLNQEWRSRSRTGRHTSLARKILLIAGNNGIITRQPLRERKSTHVGHRVETREIGIRGTLATRFVIISLHEQRKP